jgi:hypothetical protein
MVVGAYGADDETGSVYVFEKSETAWDQTAQLVSDAAAGDRFGYSVSISGDTMVVSAYYDGLNSGSAYVYEKSGTAW